jgi:hypothetical protein
LSSTRPRRKIVAAVSLLRLRTRQCAGWRHRLADRQIGL